MEPTYAWVHTECRHALCWNNPIDQLKYCLSHHIPVKILYVTPYCNQEACSCRVVLCQGPDQMLFVANRYSLPWILVPKVYIMLDYGLEWFMGNMAVSIRCTGLGTGLGEWDWTQRKLRPSFWVTETTQEIYSFHLQSRQVFNCKHSSLFSENLHMIVLCYSSPDVDFGERYSVDCC